MQLGLNSALANRDNVPMESAIAYLISLPNLLIDAVATALGAVFGGIVCKPIKSRELQGLVGLACAIAALFAAEPLVNVLRYKYAYVTEVNSLKDMAIKNTRFLSTLFKYHPDAEQQLKLSFKKILASTPPDYIVAAEGGALGKIVVQYLDQDIGNASDASIYNFLKYKLKALNMLKEQPEICAAFFAGALNHHTIPNVVAETIYRMADAEADIIESSVNSPSPPATVIRIEEIRATLGAVYASKEYPAGDLDKIDYVLSIPAEDGCRVAINFSDSIVSLGETRGAHVFKSLIFKSLNLFWKSPSFWTFPI
jgi:hypothetical protein